MRYFYWYLYLLLWLLALIAPYISLRARNCLFAFYCALWAFVFGFKRYDVGNDTPDYVSFFENRGLGMRYGTVDNPFETSEIGFVYIARFLNIFTENATIIFFIIGIFIWYIVYKLYVNHSKLPFLSLFFMLTSLGVMFYTMQIAVRQAISTGVACAGILLIYKSSNGILKTSNINKMMLGLLVLMSSITIHRTTGMIVLSMIIIYFIKINKSMAYVLLSLFTVMALVYANLITQLFDIVLILVDGISDENISLLGDRYAGVSNTATFSKSSFLGWTFLGYARIYFSEKKDLNSYFFKTFLFTCCLQQILQFTGLRMRFLCLYMIIGFIASVPEICAKSKRIYMLYMIAALYFLYLNYDWFTISDVKSDTASLYYFIWQ